MRDRLRAVNCDNPSDMIDQIGGLVHRAKWVRGRQVEKVVFETHDSVITICLNYGFEV